MTQTWCPVCNCRHSKDADCLGELNATGAERHGWRVTVETPHGFESYGVLVAPCRDLWRARILTYPNILWTIPGGQVSMKFVGRTPQEAERQAIDFIEEHCDHKHYLRRDQMVPVEGRVTNPEAARGPRREVFTAPGGRPPTPPRKVRTLPVRFGAEKASMLGSTADLSEEGMFISTPVPLDPGVSVIVHLELEGNTVPLRGLVMWNRVRREPGRPVGMGLRLVSPPPLYLSYVQTLE